MVLVEAFSVIVQLHRLIGYSTTLYSLTAETGWCWRRGRRLKSSRLCELCWETLAAAVSWADGGAQMVGQGPGPDCGEISQLDVSTPPVTTHSPAAAHARAQLVINMFPGVTISPYLQLTQLHPSRLMAV